MHETETMQAAAPEQLAAAVPIVVDRPALAELLKMSPATIDRMNSAGHLPRPLKLPGRVLRWGRDEILEWVRSGCPDRRTWDALWPGARSSGRRR